MRAAGGIRCSTKRADVMSPSQPSFWIPGSPARNLSVTSLPRPALRNCAPGIASVSVALDRLVIGAVPREAERRDRGVVDLAQIVVEPGDLEPARVGRHHPPRHQVVERGAPQHRLLAAGVHRDVAADARRVGGRRVDGKHEPRVVGGIHHAPGDHAGARLDRGDRFGTPGQRDALDRGEPLELLRVDDGRARVERDRAAGISGAAATRNDGEAELDAALHQRADFVLGVRIQHDERILDPPVGGVGHVRHAGEAVERDVVLRGVARQRAHHLTAQHRRVRRTRRRSDRRRRAPHRSAARPWRRDRPRSPRSSPHPSSPAPPRG